MVDTRRLTLREVFFEQYESARRHFYPQIGLVGDSPERGFARIRDSIGHRDVAFLLKCFRSNRFAKKASIEDRKRELIAIDKDDLSDSVVKNLSEIYNRASDTVYLNLGGNVGNMRIGFRNMAGRMESVHVRASFKLQGKSYTWQGREGFYEVHALNF